MEYLLQWSIYRNGVSTAMDYLLEWSIYCNGVSTAMEYLSQWTIYCNGEIFSSRKLLKDDTVLKQLVC